MLRIWNDLTGLGKFVASAVTAGVLLAVAWGVTEWKKSQPIVTGVPVKEAVVSQPVSPPPAPQVQQEQAASVQTAKPAEVKTPPPKQPTQGSDDPWSTLNTKGK